MQFVVAQRNPIMAARQLHLKVNLLHFRVNRRSNLALTQFWRSSYSAPINLA
jgi:hypothetical protein